MLTDYVLLDQKYVESLSIDQKFQTNPQSEKNKTFREYCFDPKILDNGRYLVVSQKQNIEIICLSQLEKISIGISSNDYMLIKTQITKGLFIFMGVKQTKDNKYSLDLYVHDLRLHHSRFQPNVISLSQKIVFKWQKGQNIGIEAAELLSNQIFLYYTQIDSKSRGIFSKQKGPLYKTKIRFYKISMINNFQLEINNQLTFSINQPIVSDFQLHSLRGDNQVNSDILVGILVCQGRFYVFEIAAVDIEPLYFDIRSSSVETELLDELSDGNSPEVQLKSIVNMIEYLVGQTQKIFRQIVIVIYLKFSHVCMLSKIDSQFNEGFEHQANGQHSPFILHHHHPIQQVLLSSYRCQSNILRNLYILSKQLLLSQKSMYALTSYQNIGQTLLVQLPQQPKLQKKWQLQRGQVLQLWIANRRVSIQQQFNVSRICGVRFQHRQFLSLFLVQRLILFPELQFVGQFDQTEQTVEENVDSFELFSCQSSQFSIFFNPNFDPLDSFHGHSHKNWEQQRQKQIIKSRYTTIEGILDLYQFLNDEGQFRIRQFILEVLYFFPLQPSKSKVGPFAKQILVAIFRQILAVRSIGIGQFWSDQYYNGYLWRLGTLILKDNPPKINSMLNSKHNKQKLVTIYEKQIVRSNCSRQEQAIMGALWHLFDLNWMKKLLSRQVTMKGWCHKLFTQLFPNQNVYLYFNFSTEGLQSQEDVGELMNHQNEDLIIKSSVREEGKFMKSAQNSQIRNKDLQQYLEQTIEIIDIAETPKKKLMEILHHLLGLYYSFENYFIQNRSHITNTYSKFYMASDSPKFKQLLNRYQLLYDSTQTLITQNHVHYICEDQDWHRLTRALSVRLLQCLRRCLIKAKDIKHNKLQAEIECLIFVHRLGVKSMPIYPRGLVLNILFYHRKQINMKELEQIMKKLSENNILGVSSIRGN